LFIEEAIEVGDDVDEALSRVAAVIAKYVKAYPEQWLLLTPAFDEDAPQPVEQSRSPQQPTQARHRESA
jgi:lauroyl/myristoyl acyltransferase